MDDDEVDSHYSNQRWNNEQQTTDNIGSHVELRRAIKSSSVFVYFRFGFFANKVFSFDSSTHQVKNPKLYLGVISGRENLFQYARR